MTTVDLLAYASTTVTGLTPQQARALAATGAVTAVPGWDAGTWTVTAASWVGVLHTEGVEVRIRPRIAIARLIFLLGYTQDPRAWREDPVGLDDQADLWPAMAQVFVRQANRALERGLLQGYRTEESAHLVLRGRLREADQLRLHPGLAVPLEVRFDEYDVDIAENQLLRAATQRLLKLPRMPPAAVRHLRQVRSKLADVSALVAGQPLPPTRPSRLNARYQPALVLARMVLRARSIDVLNAGVRATGFLVDMNTLFEDFVTVSLTEALAADGGRCVPQSHHVLDEAHLVKLRPDLVWFARGGAPAAVVDAKYKAQASTGYPNADVYQLLAYCTALRLRVGHLVYAEGEGLTKTVRINHAGITVNQHALDLTSPAPVILAQIAALADEMRRDAVPLLSSIGG